MKLVRPLVALAPVVAFAVACSPPPPAPKGPSAEEMVAAAKALDQRFVTAFNAGDAEGVTATYWNSPKAVSFPPDLMQLRGWSSIKEATSRAFAAGAAGKLELTETHHEPVGDVVLSWGLWRMTVPLPDGTSTTIEGRFTDVKAQRDGKWVYLVDHASVPLPPPPGADASVVDIAQPSGG